MLLCKIAFTFHYTSMQLLTTHLLPYIVKVTLLSFDIFPIDSLFTLFTSYLVMLLYFACICILHYRVRFLSDVFKLEPNRRLPLFPWVKRFTCFDPYSQYSVMLVTCKDLKVITTNIVIVYSRATQHL